MTALLDRVPVESITEQARQVRFGRAVLTLIAGVLFGLGWVTARALAVGWLAVAWSWTAFRVGFREGRRGPRGPSEPR
jgi:uncharacterized membrane protein YedE/YeeE